MSVKDSEVITQPATNISATGATLNGAVNPNSLSAIVTFEYGTTTGYGMTATAIQSPVTGSSIVNVSKEITGLSPGTTYHYRAKAINSLGTEYGGDMVFMTSGQIPSSTTLPATDISTAGATINGSINSNHLSATVTFEYGLTSGYGQTVTAVQSPVTGNNDVIVSATISGLTQGTTYHFRVKAVNSLGTAYGNEVIFITGSSSSATTITDIDGNIYNIISIGTQIWMKENLKVTKYNDGTAIPNVTDAWAGLTTPAYCWQNNDEGTNKAVYGALYNWYTVNTGKLCPSGWHVPSDAEWTGLTTFLGGESIAGAKLKETGTTHWTNPNTGATNETGFTALAGGSRTGEFGNGSGFSVPGLNGVWWSATTISGSTVWRRYMTNSNTIVSRDFSYKFDGLSVRCIKD